MSNLTFVHGNIPVTRDNLTIVELMHEDSVWCVNDTHAKENELSRADNVSRDEVLAMLPDTEGNGAAVFVKSKDWFYRVTAR
jgi:hypothetical protein